MKIEYSTEPSAVQRGALIERSLFGENTRVFARGEVFDSIVKTGSTVGNDAVVKRTVLETHVSINRRNNINDSRIGDLSYTGQNTLIHFADIGRCCSIAANVDIGAVDHSYHCGTTLPGEYFPAISGSIATAERWDSRLCKVGSDVWIASGVTVLRKAAIGDGALIGAGAVVTKPIPPYAIAVGVPARVIGYRFDEKTIDRLIRVSWWNWPLEMIIEHKSVLLSEVTEEMLCELEALSFGGGGFSWLLIFWCVKVRVSSCGCRNK